MIQNPFLGGNNGGGENLPQQNDSNSQFENSNNRPRNPEVNINLPRSTPLLSAVQRSNPPTLPVNRGTTHIFYKTRMCQKFLEGNCRNGDSCTFAHGSNDLREPPPNWQELVKDNRGGGNWNEDQKIIHRMRICRKFYNTGECPYGEKCNFLHESPSKFKAEAAVDMGRTRQSSVINIQTVVDHPQTEAVHLLHGNVDAVQVGTMNSDHPDALRPSMKATYWKTRICSKWEATGQCVFGDKCHFAHGLAELNTPVGRVEGDGQPYAGFSVAPKPFTGPIVEAVATNSATTVPVPQGEVREIAKWKLAHKKLNRIYADWIDDDEDEQVSSSKAD
ncbi:zinc finger CCCH domain-containing protein 39-like [Cynara cardunculus var. scolymus]|uniref:Zinc finger, CCCH-type n=1 Tax=Cynara cardunculus var. scolymus TaxID=59895 RepID=A0A103YM49_CYNCS|nr:zinc finger CCCH domain-containing protein 39-like [Cynara cardunculus var. scolymus]KVI11644.1 Zinc finger, CCCH-type [Cynara cardunculus var. scolymus]